MMQIVFVDNNREFIHEINEQILSNKCIVSNFHITTQQSDIQKIEKEIRDLDDYENSAFVILINGINKKISRINNKVDECMDIQKIDIQKNIKDVGNAIIVKVNNEESDNKERSNEKSNNKGSNEERIKKENERKPFLICTPTMNIHNNTYLAFKAILVRSMEFNSRLENQENQIKRIICPYICSLTEKESVKQIKRALIEFIEHDYTLPIFRI